MHQQRRPWRASGVGWSPFIGRDLVELHLEQRAQEVLKVVVVVDFQGRAIVFPKSELANYGVEAKTNFSHEMERILVERRFDDSSDTEADGLLVRREVSRRRGSSRW